ncbi:hypothetical protein [Haloarchaeobius sp. DYHT-AS-18]|uniref:hypothetical protein n=1 Tax=Haloarchaeobius sp. DYHT-AS-18 TaxID=3446117 RepID=UPI003EBE6C28
MSRHEATFDISDKTDAQAVQTLMEQAYNAFREELQLHNRSDSVPNEVLREFREIRDATKRTVPGTLTIVYEQRDEPFDD